MKLGVVQAVAAGDWLVHHLEVDPASLVAGVERGSGRRASIARMAEPLVRPGAWSLRESVVRLILVTAGLPEPRLNIWVGDGVRRVAIVDLAYPQWKVVVEYDGYQHADQRAQWETDVRRLVELQDCGWVVIRVTNVQLRHPRTLVRMVWRRLRAAGYDGPEPRFDAQWSAMFEGRPA